MTRLGERRQAFERYWDERRERIGMAILRSALMGALIMGGFVILNWGRVFGGDGTMSGEEFFSKVRCEQVAFVTQLRGAFGRLAPVDGNVVRYAVGGTRFRHHGGPQAGRAVKEPRRSRVPASPAPAPPRAPAADTYTDCTLP